MHQTQLQAAMQATNSTLVETLEQTLAPDTSQAVMQVTADASRCVQCGICGFNCPVGIEVREYARRGQNVTDSRCIACGNCIERCPRGTLRWGKPILILENNSLKLEADGLPALLHLQPRQAK